MVLRIPAKNLSISFASNRQDIDRMPYVKRLYELNQPWDIPEYTKNNLDEAVYRGMNNTFNYGSLHFDRTKQLYSTDEQETARAFSYFNKVVSTDALQAAFDRTLKAINDERHPVADSAFIKVGSYMAMTLRKRYGPQRVEQYHFTGRDSVFCGLHRHVQTEFSPPRGSAV